MSITTSTRQSRSAYPPGKQQQRHRHLAERQTSNVRRVSLVDQAALRLGLLLITWGRRANQSSRTQLASRFEQQVAREQRELHAERTLLLSTPRL